MNVEKDKYFIDPESAVEMARLLEQDALITGEKAIKELEEQSPETLARMRDVLDIACGTGGWARELAREHPHIHNITGVDISHRMVVYANQLAQAEQLPHVHFFKMDINNLSFPDESFDLINLRFISGFMLRDSWMPLIEKCKRLLRPNGILRLTECESTFTNNAAQNEMAELITKSLYLSGRGFNQSGTTLGIINMLPFFLRQANFHQVGIRSDAIDISYGQKDAKGVQQDFRIALNLLKPFLLQLKLIPSEKAIDELLGRMQEGWEKPDYTGIWVLLTAWGVK